MKKSTYLALALVLPVSISASTASAEDVSKWRKITHTAPVFIHEDGAYVCQVTNFGDRPIDVFVTVTHGRGIATQGKLTHRDLKTYETTRFDWSSGAHTFGRNEFERSAYVSCRIEVRGRVADIKKARGGINWVDRPFDFDNRIPDETVNFAEAR